jgi:hypothetical protein
MTKLRTLLKEVEDKANLAKLDQAMQSGLAAMASGFSSDKDALKQDVAQADIEISESITAITIIGAFLAAPKLIELIAKGFGKLISVFKSIIKPGQAKTEEGQIAAIEAIVHFTHKWHKAYIKGIKGLLKITGLFAKAGIKGDTEQTKAAELVFYTIVAGLAVYSGIGAFAAFKSGLANVAVTGGTSTGDFALGSFEAAMTAIKSGEVSGFLGKMGIKAA